MKITIRNKLLMYFGLIIVIMGLSQLIFNFCFANSLYTGYKMKYMEDTFYDLQNSYDGTIESIEEVLNDIEDTQSVQIVMYTEEEFIYMTPNEYVPYSAPVYTMNQVQPEIFPMENEPSAAKLREPSEQEEVLNLSGTIEFEDEVIYVKMNIAIASIESSVSFFSNSSLAIAIIMFIVGIFLSIRISRSITKPIEDIEKISYNMSNLQFDECASETSNTKELDSLAHSINRMSQELSSRIEALNLANEKLQKDVDYQIQIEQMRREFVANVSHEMKTPLAILQFYCENLKSDIAGIDKTYYYDTIIEETNRMNEMVKSMLDISSLENGLSKMEFEETDLSVLTLRTVEKLRPMLSAQQVEVDVEDQLIVNGDRCYLEQVLKNYITNAVSHTGEGKQIIIKMNKNNGNARISVYNEGKQIEESQLERIWESFYKSDKSRVRVDHTNVGLGLYIVKCIAENHSGLYGVMNKEDGVEFYLELPLVIE